MRMIRFPEEIRILENQKSLNVAADHSSGQETQLITLRQQALNIAEGGEDDSIQAEAQANIYES